MEIRVKNLGYLGELKASSIILNFKDVESLPKAFIHYLFKRARLSKRIIVKNANANLMKKIRLVENNLNFTKPINNNRIG